MIAEHETLAAGKPPPTHGRHAGDPGQMLAEISKSAVLRVTPKLEYLLVGTRLTRLKKTRNTRYREH